MTSRLLSLPTHFLYDQAIHGFGDQVSRGFVDDLHVGLDEVSDGLHLSLELRVSGQARVPIVARLLTAKDEA